MKNKVSKQEEQRQKHGQGEHFDGCQMGGDCWRMGEEVRGLRSTNRELQNCHWDIKQSIGNGVSKELIYTTHGHEQQCGDGLTEWEVVGGGGAYGENQVTVIA